MRVLLYWENADNFKTVLRKRLVKSPLTVENDACKLSGWEGTEEILVRM